MCHMTSASQQQLMSAACRPPSNLVSGQESTICDIAWMSAAGTFHCLSDMCRSDPVLSGNRNHARIRTNHGNERRWQQVLTRRGGRRRHQRSGQPRYDNNRCWAKLRQRRQYTTTTVLSTLQMPTPPLPPLSERVGRLQPLHESLVCQHLFQMWPSYWKLKSTANK